MLFKDRNIGSLFVLFNSLRPINNLSVIKGRVFLGWTSTKLGLMFLLKDTTQGRRWGSNPRPFGLESSTLPLSHCAPKEDWFKKKFCLNTILSRALVAPFNLFSRLEPFVQFCKGASWATIQWNHFEFGSVDQEMSFKDISYLELWSPLVQQSRHHLCNFGRMHHEE